MKRLTARSSLPRYIDDNPIVEPATMSAPEDYVYSYDPAAEPPPFGHAMRKYWGFDPAYVNLNHG